MVGVIELDTITVGETDCHMWAEGEEFHETSSNFYWLLAVTLRPSWKAWLHINFEIYTSWSRSDA